MAHKTTTGFLFSISLTALLVGCSTSLAERSPLDIASQSIRRTDTLSGSTEVLAPQINKFASKRSSVKGQLQLRTAGPFTDTKGVVHRDGAFLDIVLNYNTATPNPDETLLFINASWPGGDPATVVDFGQSVLDCTEEAREIYRVPINYSGYSRGYGGSGHSRHGLYGGNYGGHYGGYSYGPYGGYGGHHGHGGGHDGDNDDEHDTDEDMTDTGDSTDVEDSVDRPRRPRRPRTPRITDETGPGTAPEVDPVRRPRSHPGSGPTSSIGAGLKPSKPIVSRVRYGNGSTSKPVPQVSRPKPAPVSRPNPAPVSRPKPAPVSRPAQSRPSSSTNRAFKNTNNNRTRARTNVKSNMRYHPNDPYGQQAYTDYVVSYSCERQESLRIFVPRARLLAAERNGLLLYVRPKTGMEETIVLPPNYIAGFLMAAGGPDATTAPVSIGHLAKPAVEPSARTPIIYGDP